MELFDLKRFIEAQDANYSYETALQEIREEQKRSHWMWYVFPQIKGLGHSSMSRKYSIKSLLEAKAYWENGKLNERLKTAIDALPRYAYAERIFGEIDALKLKSCLTLFDLVSRHNIFDGVLDRYFDGERCERTLRIVAKEWEYYNSEESAFERNGVWTAPKAFFESSSSEGVSIKSEQRIGTFIDLLSRGESMRRLVSRYLWDKNLMHYRVSSIEFTLGKVMTYLFKAIADKTNDSNLITEMRSTYRTHAHPRADSNILLIADAIDDFWQKYRNEETVKTVAEAYMKHSRCKDLHTPSF